VVSIKERRAIFSPSCAAAVTDISITVVTGLMSLML